MQDIRRSAPVPPTPMTSHRGFSGRGPKGYQRPDERIREDVSDRFTDDEWLDASELTVNVRQGVIILAGSVPDRQQARRAESIAYAISGVRGVANKLRVGPRSAIATDRGAIVQPGTRESSLFQVTARPAATKSPITLKNA
jgi:BON domain-containing protein